MGIGAEGFAETDAIMSWVEWIDIRRPFVLAFVSTCGFQFYSRMAVDLEGSASPNERIGLELMGTRLPFVFPFVKTARLQLYGRMAVDLDDRLSRMDAAASNGRIGLKWMDIRLPFVLPFVSTARFQAFGRMTLDFEDQLVRINMYSFSRTLDPSSWLQENATTPCAAFYLHCSAIHLSAPVLSPPRAD